MKTAIIFDLTNDEDVHRLATELGASFNQTVVGIVHQLTPEQAVVFYGFLFGAPFGGMLAAIGLPAATAVMETMKTVTANIETEVSIQRH